MTKTLFLFIMITFLAFDLHAEKHKVIPVVSIAPQYPKIALENKVEGWAEMRFTINKNGSVENAVVMDSYPKEIFDKEAVKAMLKYKFAPKRVDGKNVDFEATYKITFKLPD